MLRTDQEEADKRGFYSEQLHEEFIKAGFYRMLQPRMFGGYEFDLATYYRISVEIARGGSAGIAWCLNLAHHHSYIVGSFFEEQAQREIFGDGHFVAGARAGGSATAKAVDGGYVINGRFRYSSGVPYSTHHLIAVKIDGAHPDGPPDGVMCWAVVPRDQYEILWDWGNYADLGLQASGSNTVVMKDAWIPKHWLVLDDFRSYDQTQRHARHAPAQQPSLPRQPRRHVPRRSRRAAGRHGPRCARRVRADHAHDPQLDGPPHPADGGP